MKSIHWLVLCFLAIFVTTSEGYRILAVFGFTGRSHFMMFEALMKGLARKGHQVDVISHFPRQKPLQNYTDIVDLGGKEKAVVNTFTMDFVTDLRANCAKKVATQFGNDMCDFLGKPQMQAFLKDLPNRPQYDLLLTEVFGSSCYIGMGEIVKAPVVVMSSCTEFAYVNFMMGNPYNSAFYPNLLFESAALTNFWQRLQNTVENIYYTFIYCYYTSVQTDHIHKYLSPDLPDIREVEKKVSLLLVNTHHSLNGPRPITTSIVEVGGLHVLEDESQLSPELLKWMDEATSGVVYFTLGSMVNIETYPNKTLYDMYAAFDEIKPIKVLMKVADKAKLPPGLPDNIKTLSWIPQVPVLKHPNTKLFITHGGLMGSQEALYYAVPMIGIPLFGDQMRNVDVFVKKGMAVKLDYDRITKESLSEALKRVLYDPSYRERAKIVSWTFKDRPMSAMDTSIYWMEYIIKHGADALKSPLVNMPWWQAYSLDVLLFLAGVSLIFIYLFTIIIKLLHSMSQVMLFQSQISPKKKRN